MDKDKIIKTFLELVRIDSPSGEEENISKYIEKYLTKIGIKTERDPYGNVIAFVEGAGETIMLEAHMDTVEPGRGITPLINKEIIHSDGTTILGADNKAGVASVLEATKHLIENKINHRPMELVFTREEEIGLKGAFNLDMKKIKAKKVLNVDTGSPLGYLTIAAPFIYKIDIEIIGKSAHAGVEPEKGINAIVVAAEAISKLKIGRISSDTTNNIGIMHGGLIVNGVAEKVEIKAEARSHELKKVEKQVKLFKEAFEKACKKHKAKLNFKTRIDCHGYNYSKKDPFFHEISLIMKKLGHKTVYVKSGGATNANILAGKGMQAVALSCGGKDYHTVKESIKTKEIIDTVEFLVEFCKA